jgi:replicative DNA helicase
VRASSKHPFRKDPIYNICHTEHCYNSVISHLRRNNTLTKTYAKFPPRAIYSAVKRFLEQSSSEPLDIAVTFEALRDYETVDAFLESLQAEHMINKTYSDATLEDMALTALEEQLAEHADILGKKIVNKHAATLAENEVAIPEIDYYYLKRRDAQLKKLEVAACGWTLSLM